MDDQPGIFISYRRDDALAVARRLVDDLRQRRPGWRLIVDTDWLESGDDFRQGLDQALDQTRVMLVLIGQRWLQAADAQGRRRLDDPDDWVRCEIAAGLQRDLLVVPLLVDGVVMPAVGDLPADLHRLPQRQAMTLSPRHWQRDLDGLAEQLSRLAPADPARPTPPTGALGRLLALRSMLQPAPAPAPAAVSRPPRPARPVQAAPPPVSDARDVFISYAFEDEAWARRVVGAVEGLGLRCWMASRDIPPGTASYARAITRAIHTSRLFVVLLSTACNASDDVLNEITLAKNAGVPRLPVRIDDAPIGDGLLYFFSQAQRLEGGGQDVAAMLARVTDAVRLQLGGNSPAA